MLAMEKLVQLRELGDDWIPVYVDQYTYDLDTCFDEEEVIDHVFRILD